MGFRWKPTARLRVIVMIGVCTSLATTAQAARASFGGDVLRVDPAGLSGWPPDVAVQSAWLEVEGKLLPLEVQSGSQHLSGIFEVTMPPVRLRTEGRVWLAGMRGEDGDFHTSFPATILPAGALSWVREGLSQRSVGLYDPSGRFRRILERERIPYEDVSTRHALDFFNGQLLLIGPDVFAAWDADFCARLTDRVLRGMRLLLLGQSVAWEGLGLQCEEGPLSTTFRLTGAMVPWRDLLQEGDLEGATARWYIDCTGSAIGTSYWRWCPWILAEKAGCWRTVAGRLEVGLGGLWVLPVSDGRELRDSPLSYTLCVAALLDMMSFDRSGLRVEEDVR